MTLRYRCNTLLTGATKAIWIDGQLWVRDIPHDSEIYEYEYMKIIYVNCGWTASAQVVETSVTVNNSSFCWTQAKQNNISSNKDLVVLGNYTKNSLHSKYGCKVVKKLNNYIEYRQKSALLPSFALDRKLTKWIQNELRSPTQIHLKQWAVHSLNSWRL